MNEPSDPENPDPNSHCPRCGSVVREGETCAACLFGDALSDGTGKSRPRPVEGLPEIPGYDLLELIGRGSTGAVLLASAQEEGTPAAVKILGRELADDPEYLGRFRREAEALQKLDHPGFVRLITWGGELQRPPNEVDAGLRVPQ